MSLEEKLKDRLNINDLSDYIRAVKVLNKPITVLDESGFVFASAKAGSLLKVLSFDLLTSTVVDFDINREKVVLLYIDLGF